MTFLPSLCTDVELRLQTCGGCGKTTRMLKIDRQAFLALALGMNLGACYTQASGTAGYGTQPRVMPQPTAEAGYGGPAQECVGWTPSGECNQWEPRNEVGMSPTQECIQWDPSGECTDWDQIEPAQECVGWTPAGECNRWEPRREY